MGLKLSKSNACILNDRQDTSKWIENGGILLPWMGCQENVGDEAKIWRKIQRDKNSQYDKFIQTLGAVWSYIVGVNLEKTASQYRRCFCLGVSADFPQVERVPSKP